MTLEQLLKDDRFFSKVNKTETCWLWTAGQMSGYGWYYHSELKRNFRSHQVVMLSLFGPPKEGYEVCHKCGVRLCVNPAHLYYGTRQDNIQDMIKAGKHNFFNRPRPQGEAQHSSVFTDNEVLLFRDLNRGFGWGPITLSKRYGFNKNALNNILYGDRFKHLRKAG